MKWTARAAVAAVTIGMLAGFAPHVEAQANARAQIASNYNAMSSALKRKDVNGIMKHYSNSFTATAPNGQKVSKAQMSDALRASMGALQVQTADVKIIGFRQNGNRASVTTSTRMVARVQNPQTKKVQTIVVTGSDQDTWQRNGNQWQIVANKSLNQKISVDGKVMVHTGPGGKPIQPKR